MGKRESCDSRHVSLEVATHAARSLTHELGVTTTVPLIPPANWGNGVL